MEAQELKELIQQSVRETIDEVLREERLALRLALIPRITEQQSGQVFTRKLSIG